MTNEFDWRYSHNTTPEGWSDWLKKNWPKAYELIEKQARAEVLAACISATCVLCRTEKPYLMWFGGKNWKGRYQAWVHDVKLEGRIEIQTCPANAIHSLQPAAEALGALLRPGRELAEAVLSWETAMDVNKVLDENTKRIYDATAQMLEKARALVEGKKK